MLLFDAHTHNPSRKPTCLEIESLDLRKVAKGVWKETGWFVVGMHPWWLRDLPTEVVNDLICDLVAKKNCLGLGETGLDRVIDTSLDIQMSWLKKHFEWAVKGQKKLVVLHIVRTWSELKSFLKECSFEGVILLHDCSASPHDMSWLIKDHRIWFSYGSALFRPQSRGFEGFQVAPASRLLFETDDSKKDITQIYKQANALRDLTGTDQNASDFLRLINN